MATILLSRVDSRAIGTTASGAESGRQDLVISSRCVAYSSAAIPYLSAASSHAISLS
jgi:hypothetical protein